PFPFNGHAKPAFHSVLAARGEQIRMGLLVAICHFDTDGQQTRRRATVQPALHVEGHGSAFIQRGLGHVAAAVCGDRRKESEEGEPWPQPCLKSNATRGFHSWKGGDQILAALRLEGSGLSWAGTPSSSLATIRSGVRPSSLAL